MACECIEVMNTKLAGHNTRIVTSFCTTPDMGHGWYDTVTLECEKIVPRKRDRVRVAATFCPFCGVRYTPASAIP